MTRYVIGPDVALRLAGDRVVVGDEHRLGDRVLQSVAWSVADQLGWTDTYTAEYLAATRLQADAFITLDERLAREVKDPVTLAPVEALA